MLVTIVLLGVAQPQTFPSCDTLNATCPSVDLILGGVVYVRDFPSRCLYTQWELDDNFDEVNATGLHCCIQENLESELCDNQQSEGGVCNDNVQCGDYYNQCMKADGTGPCPVPFVGSPGDCVCAASPSPPPYPPGIAQDGCGGAQEGELCANGFICGKVGSFLTCCANNQTKEGRCDAQDLDQPCFYEDECTGEFVCANVSSPGVQAVLYYDVFEDDVWYYANCNSSAVANFGECVCSYGLFTKESPPSPPSPTSSSTSSSFILLVFGLIVVVIGVLVAARACGVTD